MTHRSTSARRSKSVSATLSPLDAAASRDAAAPGAGAGPRAAPSPGRSPARSGTALAAEAGNTVRTVESTGNRAHPPQASC
ncbi:hypothetical protein [Streptomyces sp. SHP 1-2]|uniref:hypothetical protein n=1 Tax=Streptomyces sp. SHP 1-2 TaxID=2769489 RepID=UPI0022383808|nr:hypothetical protein [Streptomyces sp. SHP 1-2]MCW5250349.1 hypothetical protein [Streptomyces sp. SHP 1-2]